MRREVVTDSQLETAASRVRASLESLVDSIGDWEPQNQEGRRVKGAKGKINPLPDDPPRHWRDHALCKHANGDWVGPTKGRAITAMRESRRIELAVCDACPVRIECLDYGMSQPYGIFGGLLPAERTRLRRTRK